MHISYCIVSYVYTVSPHFSLPQGGARAANRQGHEVPHVRDAIGGVAMTAPINTAPHTDLLRLHRTPSAAHALL